MILPSYLLLAMGVLGSADILFFHTLAHSLRRHAPARAELVTHFLRGPTYALLFLVVPNFALAGPWLLCLWLLLGFDLVISIADFWLEPESRRFLGGLPRGEYLLHIALAMLFGALVAAVGYDAGFDFTAPAALDWRAHGASPVVRISLALMAPLVLATGIADLVAVRRLARVRA